MKQLTNLFGWTLGFLGLVLAAPFAAAADLPDVYAYSNLSRGLDCKLVQFIVAQPEWQPFVDAFTKKIDAEYEKARSGHNFPKELADMALDKVRDASGKKDISSKDVIQVILEEFEAFQISVWLESGVEKPEIAVSIFTKFNPVELESFLKFVPEWMYKKLKQDSTGTIYKFSQDDKQMYVGYIPLADRSDYVIAVSEKQNRVEQLLGYAQTGEFLKTALRPDGAFKMVEVTPAFFETARDNILKQIKSKTNKDPNAENLVKILENLESLKYEVADDSETTSGNLSLTMKNDEDAKNLKEIADGFVAMLKFFGTYNAEIDENGKKMIALVSKIAIQQDSKTVSATIKCNTPEIESLIKEILAKATEELKK